MIGRLTGVLVEKELRGVVVVEAGGVGYEVTLPMTDLTRCGSVGEKVTLRIHTHVREDALQLYGFLGDDGRTAFQTLLTVNGVGPKLALAILSGIEPGELAAAVAQKDVARLTSIPGVGKKTAERLCLELAGKLGPVTTFKPGVTPSAAQVLQDLSSALTNLGYRTQQVDKVLKALESDARGGTPMESLIRDALKLLAGGTDKARSVE